MRLLIMGRLIWIYAVWKNILLSPVAVKELIEIAFPRKGLGSVAISLIN